MNSNTSGRLFSFTTWGESHGPAIGVVVDGCPAGIALGADDVQPWLDRRRPGRNAFVSPRREKDKIKILSGVYDGQTTGHPIMMLIENTDARSADYAPIHDVFRPGHADASWQWKYGLRDPRGGGRSSARETACRVAAGAVARRVLAHFPETAGVAVRAGLVELGGIKAEAWADEEVDANPLFCPDAAALAGMTSVLEAAAAAGDSLGGIVEIRARGVPPGLGEPMYDKLDARIAGVCMGLNAVKGVEIGDGFAAARARGLGNNDAMRSPAAFLTNHAGGILGGVSTGEEIIVRCAVKPTPSISLPQNSVDRAGNDVTLSVTGRHDPAVCIRAVPVLEAMLAATLADFLLLSRARTRAERDGIKIPEKNLDADGRNH